MRGSGSNLKIFLLITVIMAMTISCRRSDLDPIPDVRVDFYISLDDPQFFDLTVITGYALVNSSTNNMGVYAAGFDNNGIIIYHATEDEFLAFDRTCPYDYAINNLSIAVNVDGVYAVCPECNSTWALPSFGAPSQGPSKYPLKEYRATFDGTYIYVTNR